MKFPCNYKALCPRAALCSNGGMTGFSLRASVLGTGLGRRQQLLLWTLIGLCCLPELVFFAAEQGWIPAGPWRNLMLQHAAFWTGLLHNWRPNYALQPWVMFVSYGFLHADLWHLIGNMLVLAILGRMVLLRVGALGFGLIYFGALLAGAVGFALLSNSSQPMVGASGALFGLIGAWQLWQWQELAGESRWPVVRLMLWLVALNVAMGLIQPGGVAWETHLGGYVGGGLVALLPLVRMQRASD